MLRTLILLAFLVSHLGAQSHPEPLELHRVEASYQPPYYTTLYAPPAQPKEGELQIGVQYTLWIPPGLEKVRGIIVHQHGCGEGACLKSVTAAHDLHWQELARRTECALLGPSFRQRQEQDCKLWCDARNGSRDVFVESLEILADKSGHPEIATAPWCLWGHSGGGWWASAMQLLDPNRIVAIWFQSGTAFSREDGFEMADLPEGALDIPMIANPGIEERTHERFHTAWDASLAMTQAYRERNAPIAFTPDPKSGHQTGDSRYLAIPFFEACLELRLPKKPGNPLRRIDPNSGWLTPILSDDAPRPSSGYAGKATQANWLPTEAVAKAWRDFVTTGTVSDTTPPPAPTNVAFDPITGRLTWQADIDYESGLRAFIIQRDGKTIGRFPENPANPWGRPLLQGMSYGDTPERLLAFEFIDTDALYTKEREYRVIAVNSAGVKSD